MTDIPALQLSPEAVNAGHARICNCDKGEGCDGYQYAKASIYAAYAVDQPRVPALVQALETILHYLQWAIDEDGADATQAGAMIDEARAALAPFRQEDNP